MKIRRYLDVCIHNDSSYREIIRMLLIKCEEEVIAFRTSFRGLLRRCPLQHFGEDCDGEFGRLRQGLNLVKKTIVTADTFHLNEGCSARESTGADADEKLKHLKVDYPEP